MILNVVRISSFINELYPNKQYVILDNGTCVFIPENIVNIKDYINNIFSNFEHGEINYHSKWINDDNLVVSFDVDNVIVPVFLSEINSKNISKDFIELQGRNKLVRDLYSIGIYAIFQGDKEIEFSNLLK